MRLSNLCDQLFKMTAYMFLDLQKIESQFSCSVPQYSVKSPHFHKSTKTHLQLANCIQAKLKITSKSLFYTAKISSFFFLTILWLVCVLVCACMDVSVHSIQPDQLAL